MREKYESLSATVLKDLAKARGIKGLTGMKKEQLVEAMLAQDEKEKAATAEKQEEKKVVYTANNNQTSVVKEETSDLDSGQIADGILEVMADGYGFIRCENFLPGENDIYVSPAQIRRFNLKTGDMVRGGIRVKNQGEKFAALLYVTSVNGFKPEEISRRPNFEDLTPIFPNERIHLDRPGASVAMRVVDLVSPVGKGQRGMIVSQPKAGKTTLLKEIANSITQNNPEMHLIILLIDERPEEVTDIKESVKGTNVEVIHSTFDELPEHHKRVSEMVIERAKRLVEHKQDVIILLDSITRLARAYNLTVQPSGRTLSGGLDPAALHMPKRFFGAARNMREGGSLTVLATALVDTGSKMDDVVFEEFKGTGNMELVLDRKLSEKRIFPAIDIVKSGTRRDDLLLDAEEMEAMDIMRKAFNGMKADEAVENILNMFAHTKNNKEFTQQLRKTRLF
ncbi:MAG: transcription termination factor Rho [Agathobacter sp.]|nr:transcription termination factor Rho [Agathobacter sp.]